MTESEELKEKSCFESIISILETDFVSTSRSLSENVVFFFFFFTVQSLWQTYRCSFEKPGIYIKLMDLNLFTLGENNNSGF